MIYEMMNDDENLDEKSSLGISNKSR